MLSLDSWLNTNARATCVSPSPNSLPTFGVEVIMERMCISTKCNSMDEEKSRLLIVTISLPMRQGRNRGLQAIVGSFYGSKEGYLYTHQPIATPILFSLIDYLLPVVRQAFTIPFIFIHGIVIAVLIIIFFILSPCTPLFLLPLHVLLL